MKRILQVERVGAGAVTSYTYGNSGVERGQVLSVTDHLTGLVQSIALLWSIGKKSWQALKAR